MFYEGDVVEVTNLDVSVQEMLADALESDFEDIEFYFIEYLDEDYATLSAETDIKFAIIHCPLDALEEYYDDVAEVEKLFDHIINTHIMDRALRERNEELFHAIGAYNQTPKPTKEASQEHVYVDQIIDLDEVWEDEIFGDED